MDFSTKADKLCQEAYRTKRRVPIQTVFSKRKKQDAETYTSNRSEETNVAPRVVLTGFSSEIFPDANISCNSIIADGSAYATTADNVPVEDGDIMNDTPISDVMDDIPSHDYAVMKDSDVNEEASCLSVI